MKIEVFKDSSFLGRLFLFLRTCDDFSALRNCRNLKSVSQLPERIFAQRLVQCNVAESTQCLSLPCISDFLSYSALALYNKQLPSCLSWCWVITTIKRKPSPAIEPWVARSHSASHRNTRELTRYSCFEIYVHISFFLTSFTNKRKENENRHVTHLCFNNLTANNFHREENRHSLSVIDKGTSNNNLAVCLSIREKKKLR